MSEGILNNALGVYLNKYGECLNQRLVFSFQNSSEAYNRAVTKAFANVRVYKSSLSVDLKFHFFQS